MIDENEDEDENNKINHPEAVLRLLSVVKRK